jgi:hypothetical protein
MSMPRVETAAPSLAPSIARSSVGYRDDLREYGELLESLGVSIREAAFRGQDGLVRRHMEDARRVLREAGAVLKGLEAAGAIRAADGEPA